MRRPQRHVDANAFALRAAAEAALRGCTAGVLRRVLTALVQRLNAMRQVQSTICGCNGCNLVALAPRKDGTALASVLPAASRAGRKKPSRSLRASAAAVRQIQLPLQAQTHGPDIGSISAALRLGLHRINGLKALDRRDRSPTPSPSTAATRGSPPRTITTNQMPPQ